MAGAPVARMNGASILKGVKRCARVGTSRSVEADRKRCSHAEAMERSARKATAYVTKSRSGDVHQKFEWRDTGENKS